jgi:hypothetical protein
LLALLQINLWSEKNEPSACRKSGLGPSDAGWFTRNSSSISRFLMKRTSKSSVQETTENSLMRILTKLIEIALESGVGVSEMQSFLRQCAVGLVAERQIADGGRVNISGISAATGLPRSAVSAALRIPARGSKGGQIRTQATNRVLGYWHRDPKFIGEDGLPADLPIYGKGATFESLTKRHGRGIPVRALLDELSRISAVEVLPNQRVRPRSIIAVNRGIDNELIEAVGLRTYDLLQTFLDNIRTRSQPRFVATVQSSKIADVRKPYIRREIEKRSAAFLAGIEETLLPPGPRSRGATGNPAEVGRIGVTVYYHEQEPIARRGRSAPRRRKNFKRTKSRLD